MMPTVVMESKSFSNLSSAAFRPEWKKLFVYLKHCLNSFHVLLTKNILMDMLKYLPCAVFLLPRKENDDDTLSVIRLSAKLIIDDNKLV